MSWLNPSDEMVATIRAAQEDENPMKAFKVGDRVTAFGLVGTVHCIDNDLVSVDWDIPGPCNEWFYPDGKLETHHKEPGLKHYEDKQIEGLKWTCSKCGPQFKPFFEIEVDHLRGHHSDSPPKKMVYPAMFKRDGRYELDETLYFESIEQAKEWAGGPGGEVVLLKDRGVEI